MGTLAQNSQTYLSRNGQQFGPYTVDAVRQMSRDGQFQDGDFLWDESAKAWKTPNEFIQSQELTPVPPPPMISGLAGGERVFYQSNGVLVTKTRLVIGAQTYSIANITSVHGNVIPASRTGSTTAIAIGVLLFVIGICLAATSGASSFFETGVSPLVLVAGVVLGGLGLYCYRQARDVYVVTLNTAGMEVQGLSSPDKDFIALVIAAISQAIIARG